MRTLLDTHNLFNLCTRLLYVRTLALLSIRHSAARRQTTPLSRVKGWGNVRIPDGDGFGPTKGDDLDWSFDVMER